MRRFAEDTQVAVSKSRAEIDRLLRDWGCDAIQWVDQLKNSKSTLRFVWSLKEDGGRKTQFVARFDVILPDQTDLEHDAKDGRSGRLSEIKLAKLMDQRGRSEHRLLLLWLKAAFNACNAGMVDPAAIFLPFIEGQDGMTVYEHAQKKLPSFLGGSADRLLPAGI